MSGFMPFDPGVSKLLNTAVGRLLSVDRNDCHGCGVYSTDEECMADLWEVFDANHRATDDLPVTNGWLETLGYDDETNFRYEKTYSIGNKLLIKAYACKGGRWRHELYVTDLQGDQVIVTDNPTVGDIRLLCKALRIEPKQIQK